MKDAQIPLTLQLWSLGHSAPDIARRLGLPNRDHVTRIIAHARSLNDPRAVYHRDSRGVILANVPVRSSAKVWCGFEVVPLIEPPPSKHCRRGHLLTPDNVVDGNRCRVCKRINRAATYQRHGK